MKLKFDAIELQRRPSGQNIPSHLRRGIRLDLDPGGYAAPAETPFHASSLKAARSTTIILFVLGESKVKKIKCKKIFSLEAIFIFAHHDKEIFAKRLARHIVNQGSHIEASNNSL
jgi:hypothetical protein